MDKEKAKQWLIDTVNDMFMDMLNYDRKGDDEMSLEHLKSLMQNGIISKEDMIEVFTNQIEKEYTHD